MALPERSRESIASGAAARLGWGQGGDAVMGETGHEARTGGSNAGVASVMSFASA